MSSIMDFSEFLGLFFVRFEVKIIALFMAIEEKVRVGRGKLQSWLITMSKFPKSCTSCGAPCKGG